MNALAHLADVQQVLDAVDVARNAALAARDSLVHQLRAEGFTQRETAALLGISFQRVSQIERAGWQGGKLSTPAERLETAREAFQAAKHAQKLREERQAMGYREETKGFYGDPSVATAEHSEEPVRWAGWHLAAHAEPA